MKIYQHILVVVNHLTEREAVFIQEVITEHPEVQVKLSLIYTLPKIPVEYFYLPSVVALKTELEEEAHAHLDRMSALLKIPSEECGIISGSGVRGIERIAKILEVDMIINNSEEIVAIQCQRLEIPSVKLDNSLRDAIGTYVTRGGVMAY